jgi:O-antigen ligase
MALRPSVTLDPLQPHAPDVPLQLSSRLLLTGSLFFILAGNIPLDGDQQSPAAAIIRAAGLACGAGCLLMAWAKQGRDLRIESLAISLSPFAIFLTYCMFSAVWSLQPSVTLVRSAETMTTIMLAALWTQVAILQGATERQLCAWIAVAVVAVTLYGLLVNAALFGDPIRIVANNQESNRPRLVFGGLHALAAGNILAIGTIATIMAGFRLVLKVFVLMLLMPLLYLTNATSAMLLVAVITVTYLGASAVRSTGMARAIILLPLVVMTAYFAVAIAVALELPVAQKIIENQWIWTLSDRTLLWSAIWELGLASTWFGTGFNAAPNAIVEIFGFAYQVHNQYLAIMIELGYVGLVLFILVIAIWLVRIIKSGSLVLGCFALYVLGINMDSASMFTNSWPIFLTVFCYVFAIGRLSKSTPLADQPIKAGT